MMTTKCCGLRIDERLDDCPVSWDEYCQVIKCQHCGCVYEPERRGLEVWTTAQLVFLTFMTLIPCGLALWAIFAK